MQDFVVLGRVLLPSDIGQVDFVGVVVAVQRGGFQSLLDAFLVELECRPAEAHLVAYGYNDTAEEGLAEHAAPNVLRCQVYVRLYVAHARSRAIPKHAEEVPVAFKLLAVPHAYFLVLDLWKD